MNTLVDLAHAYLAQLHPLTGTRGTGAVTATATGADVEVPRNTYLVPVRDGAAMYHWPFKTAGNPATAQPHNQGGEWTVTGAGTQVTIQSNVGGKWANLKAGDVLRWEPPIAGLEPTVTVTADFTGGDEGSIKEVRFFEDLETSRQASDFFDAKLGRFPALLLIWFRSTPVEGRTTGMSRGGSRAQSGVTLNFEQFAAYVITSRLDADPRRRREGLDLMAAVSGALTDVGRNLDGELLASAGSVEVLERARFARGPSAYVYAVTVRSAIALCRQDTRTFVPWLRSRYVDILEAEGPLPEGQKIDVTYNMP